MYSVMRCPFEVICRDPSAAATLNFSKMTSYVAPALRFSEEKKLSPLPYTHSSRMQNLCTSGICQPHAVCCITHPFSQKFRDQHTSNSNNLRLYGMSTSSFIYSMTSRMWCYRSNFLFSCFVNSNNSITFKQLDHFQITRSPFNFSSTDTTLGAFSQTKISGGVVPPPGKQ